MTLFERSRGRLAVHGLGAGGFHPTAEDRVPAGAQTLVIATGSLPAMWADFRTAPESRDGRPDPLDRWSRRVLDEIAAELDADTAFPFGDPPYWPFLDWSRRAEPLWPSPVGLHVHAEYGLWYSCRGALTFREHLELPPASEAARPCDSCAGQPCLHACPADAFRDGVYDAGRCADHVRSEEGEACRTGGCLVRRACPVGTSFIQEPERAEFHMQAFLRSYDEGMAHGMDASFRPKASSDD